MKPARYTSIPYQRKQRGSFFLLLFISLIFLGYSQGRFGTQTQFAAGQRKQLEGSLGLGERPLQHVAGTLYLGPNKSVRPARYSFIGEPATLYFWLYNFTYEDARRQFHEIASKGTEIRGIMEKSQYGQREDLYGELLTAFHGNANIHLIPDDRLDVQFMHAKTFLTPNKFIIQTANLTYSSFSKNREAFFMSTDSGVLASLHYLHDADRYDMPFDRALLHPNLVVCPINCRARVEGLLSGATTSIRMFQQYIYDEGVQKVLMKKHTEGVDIQIILGDTGDPQGSTMKDADLLFATTMGDAIRKQANPYIHAKMILIDDTYLLVGSMNMSDTSLNKNREIGIILMQPEHIRYFNAVFAKDWKGGK